MVSVDYWNLKYNDSTLLFSHISREDTTLILDCKKFKTTDSIRYSYHPCFHNDHVNYLTRLYLVTPQNKKFLLVEQKSNGFWFGNFSVNTLQKIADSCDCNIFRMEENVTESWTNEKGKKKTEKPTSSTMLNLKLNR